MHDRAMDSLFPPRNLQQITDDAEGGVRYWETLLTPAFATDCFETARANAAWRAESRVMYERRVTVPRLTASYRLDALPSLLSILRLVLDRVREKVDAPYNTVGLNFYRDGQDSVAMHNDKLHTLVAAQPIAIVSLGHERRMHIRAKDPPRQTIRIPLAPGSLLVMSHASQLTHEHGIPKSKRATGPRISVMFRVRP